MRLKEPDRGAPEGAFEKMILDPRMQSKIGPAWRLFMFVYFTSDPRGFLKLSHIQLEKQLAVNLWTLRSWRRALAEGEVVDSVANSRHVFFYLQEPWVSAKKVECLNQN